jgi:phage/plasmid-associated DNA primase
MSRQVKKKLTDKDFPITSLMKDAIVLSQDPVEDFIIEMNEGEFTGDELYIAYKQFMDKSGLEFKDNKKQFEMKFGRLMEKYQVEKKKIDRKETDDNGNNIRARFTVYSKK